MSTLDFANQNLFFQNYTLTELNTQFNSYTELDKHASSFLEQDKHRILYISNQIDEVVSLYFDRPTDLTYSTMFKFYLKEFINYCSTQVKIPNNIENISLLFDNFYKIINNLDYVPDDCKEDLLYMSCFISEHSKLYNLKNFTYHIISLKRTVVYHELVNLFYLEGALSLYSLVDMNLLHTLDTHRLSSLLNYGVTSVSFDFNATEISCIPLNFDMYIHLEWMLVTYLCCKKDDLIEYSDLVFKLMTFLYFIDLYKVQNLARYNKLENLFDVIAITVYGSRYEVVKQIARALKVTHNYLYWREAVIKDDIITSELPVL